MARRPTDDQRPIRENGQRWFALRSVNSLAAISEWPAEHSLPSANSMAQRRATVALPRKSFSHLERLLSTGRKGVRAQAPSPPKRIESLGESRAIDPATGWKISPMAAASLCTKPTSMLTPSEAANVGALKEALPSFVVMRRRLAMRFRGLLRGADPSKLGRFLHDAGGSGLRSRQQFARTLTRDIEAVRYAIAEPWSSGQARTGQSAQDAQALHARLCRR